MSFRRLLPLMVTLALTAGACASDPREPNRQAEQAVEGSNCTRSQGYWKNHPEQWATDGELCAKSYIDWLHTPPRGKAWVILARQWIAATLNEASGADVPVGVADTLEEAAGLLAACEISGADRAAALALKDTLEAYNEGDSGPGHCDDHGPGDDDVDAGDRDVGSDAGDVDADAGDVDADAGDVDAGAGDVGNDTDVPDTGDSPCDDFLQPGCVDRGCPDGFACDVTAGCVPSDCCDPVDGSLSCSDDCGGGVCVPIDIDCDDPTPDAFQDCYSATTESACWLAGGTWSAIGAPGFCTCPLPDANCPCATGTDCSSACYLVPDTGVGACYPWTGASVNCVDGCGSFPGCFELPHCNDCQFGQICGVNCGSSGCETFPIYTCNNPNLDCVFPF